MFKYNQQRQPSKKDLVEQCIYEGSENYIEEDKERLIVTPSLKANNGSRCSNPFSSERLVLILTPLAQDSLLLKNNFTFVWISYYEKLLTQGLKNRNNHLEGSR